MPGESKQTQSEIRNPKSETPYYFCTYFDTNYLTRGLALYHSLRRHCKRPFILWILCFDEETYDILSRLHLPGARLISQQEFEAGDEALVRTKADRSRVEYYWTCTPSLLLYVLRHNPEVEIITYLDADLYFYASPAPIYDELGRRSILIIEHRYTADRAYAAETMGIYNVSLLVFRRDERGLECLAWWRDRCLEWCYRRSEGGRFGDQKYLDDWTSRFEGVVVLRHQGAGVAPWNLDPYHFARRNGQLMVNNDPLIFFHFHGFRIRASWLFEPVGSGYSPLSRLVRSHVCAPYIRDLRRAMQEVERIKPGLRLSTHSAVPWYTLLRKLLQKRLMIAFGRRIR